MKQDRVTLTAGGLAYYWFLSLFPALIAAVGLVALLKLDPGLVRDILNGIKKALPPGASGVLSDAVNSATQSSTGAERAAIVGLVIAVWSASSGMGALQDGLNIAYDVPEDRKFLPKGVIGILMLLLILLLGVVPAALFSSGNRWEHSSTSTCRCPGLSSTSSGSWPSPRWRSSA